MDNHGMVITVNDVGRTVYNGLGHRGKIVQVTKCWAAVVWDDSAATHGYSLCGQWSESPSSQDLTWHNPESAKHNKQVYKDIWLTTFIEYIKSGHPVIHASAAAASAVDYYKKFESSSFVQDSILN